MRITIYQINHNRDKNHVIFMPHDQLERLQGSAEIDGKIYDRVYSSEVPCSDLEDVFRMFNLDYPEDFKGRSLSVSDVVEASGSEAVADGFYFCDNFGFKKVPFCRDFLF